MRSRGRGAGRRRCPSRRGARTRRGCPAGRLRGPCARRVGSGPVARSSRRAARRHRTSLRRRRARGNVARPTSPRHASRSPAGTSPRRSRGSACRRSRPCESPTCRRRRRAPHVQLTSYRRGRPGCQRSGSMSRSKSPSTDRREDGVDVEFGDPEPDRCGRSVDLHSPDDATVGRHRQPRMAEERVGDEHEVDRTGEPAEVPPVGAHRRDAVAFSAVVDLDHERVLPGARRPVNSTAYGPKPPKCVASSSPSKKTRLV